MTPANFDTAQAYSLYADYLFDSFGQLLISTRAYLDGDESQLEAIRAQLAGTEAVVLPPTALAGADAAQ